MNYLDVDYLLGRRFVTDARVLSVGGLPASKNPDDRRVTLALNGGRGEISFGELRAMIEAGFLVDTDQFDSKRRH